jgi:hypothetical protein
MLLLMPKREVVARKGQCPYCGAVILCEDAVRTIHHEDPLCSEFLDLVRETGGSEPFVTIIETDESPISLN